MAELRNDGKVNYDLTDNPNQIYSPHLFQSGAIITMGLPSVHFKGFLSYDDSCP